jgi:hypothetical protein
MVRKPAWINLTSKVIANPTKEGVAILNSRTQTIQFISWLFVEIASSQAPRNDSGVTGEI